MVDLLGQHAGLADKAVIDLRLHPLKSCDLRVAPDPGRAGLGVNSDDVVVEETFEGFFQFPYDLFACLDFSLESCNLFRIVLRIEQCDLGLECCDFFLQCLDRAPNDLSTGAFLDKVPDEPETIVLGERGRRIRRRPEPLPRR
jgi:hypothetical protein